MTKEQQGFENLINVGILWKILNLSVMPQFEVAALLPTASSRSDVQPRSGHFSEDAEMSKGGHSTQTGIDEPPTFRMAATFDWRTNFL
ncbi:MAG: hypothetical protein ABSF91_06790 [Bacteroidota bacterium]